MSWWFEAWERRSEKNGLINVIRTLGAWKVMVDGVYETAPYTNRMWREALRRMPKRAPAKHVLLLGLAAGGIVRPLHERFPRAQITAVEWDPVMVEIMDRLRLFPPNERPRIVLGDARAVVPRLSERFDVIVVDLFKGRELPSVLYEEKFLAELKHRLAPQGCLLLNVFSATPVLDRFDRTFSGQAAWQFQNNRLALYRPFGCGQVGDPWPAGYRNYRSVEGYVRREVDSKPGLSAAETGGVFGQRWHHGPLAFENYFSDDEPNVLPMKKRRLVIWQTLTRQDCPRGWRRSWIQMNPRLTGFAEIKNPARYWEDWSPHMRRHRERWQNQTGSVIRDVSPEAFLAAYQHSSQKDSLKQLYAELLPQKIRAHGERVRLLGACNASGEIVAGLAAVDVPEISLSIHLIAFHLPQAEKTSAGVGLIDAWFRHAIERNIRFLDFDLFWAPGDPASWQGFSRFKSQFGTNFIRYPKPLIRWI